MDEVKPAADAFYQKLWSTRGSRFVARARLRTMNVLSVAAVAILSVYVIAFSIFGLLFQHEITDFGQSLINAINLSLSVGILAFSLIESSRKHLVESEGMNLCALDIGKIYDQFLISYKSRVLTVEELRKFSQEYSQVLDRYGGNHLDIDYLKFQTTNRSDFGLNDLRGWMKCRWIDAHYWVSIIWLYLLAILAPPFGTGLLLWRLHGNIFR